MSDEFLTRAAETLGVNFPDRTIDLIVIPYGKEALVPYEPMMGPRPRGGSGAVIERVRAGAFDGIEKRANRIRVNREHKRELTVGKTLAFHPDDPRGLFARVKISRTPLGDEALELANDESLEASAGFLPMPGASEWLDRDHVEHSKCWLRHIALTPEGAYGENAPVLAVRSAVEPPGSRPATPNIDTVLAWRLQQQYDSLVER